MNKLKEEFEILLDNLCGLGLYKNTAGGWSSDNMVTASGESIDLTKKVDSIWNWINQNYVSKEEVRGLKMEEKDSQIFNPMTQTYYHDRYIQGENHKVDEINQKIEGVLNK